jgi:hypothetical protein
MKTHPFLQFADRAQIEKDALGCDRRSRQQQAENAGLSLGLDCQALAALGAACVQHGTAAAGCHAGAEAMSALAADDGRLVSTFHYGLAWFRLIQLENKFDLVRIFMPCTWFLHLLPSRTTPGSHMLNILTLRPPQVKNGAHNTNFSTTRGSEP